MWYKQDVFNESTMTMAKLLWLAFLFAVNKTEAECLIRLFNGLLGDQTDKRVGNGLDRGKFRNILHKTFGMTDDMIMDRGTYHNERMNTKIESGSQG